MEVFDPVRYSLAENKFFLSHLGESPVAVMQDTLPNGVNPVAVQEVLGQLYELEELNKHRGIAWAGKEAIADIIAKYLHEHERWSEMSTRGAPRFPTMHAWDGRGRPHRGGITSDAGSVSTYFDENGERVSFRVSLRGTAAEVFKAPWVKKAEPVPDALIEDTENGSLKCPVDGWVANFKIDSRQSYNMARARMSRHCKTSKDDRVREFGMKVFG